MARTVTLDAMIAREDFAVQSNEGASTDAVTTLSVENLASGGMISALLRKPDFQRETNHWTSAQLVSFLESFLDNELIPSIILWKSASFVFVIDGGHRLSALRAWIEDDYGDGIISNKYFSNNISDEQRKISKSTALSISKKIGTYKTLKDALIDPDKYSSEIVRRARTMATRQLNLQWVAGDANKAESSFFKINTLGTPLDKIEELLLRNRKKTVAIGARSVVRAATGHKYWSKFDDNAKDEIESRSKEIHKVLFDPEMVMPAKTLDLPLGGTKSPIVALNVLMQIFSICELDEKNDPLDLNSFEDDEGGVATTKLLTRVLNILSWLRGNNAKSLGLHPAVYFYSDKGRHVPDLLLGTIWMISEKIKENQKSFFRDYSAVRARLECILIENKALIIQSLQATMSKKRPEKFKNFMIELVKALNSDVKINDRWIANAIASGTADRIIMLNESASGSNFTDNAKSEAFLKKALDITLKCEICGGFLDIENSVSYDHIVRKVEGGLGDASNCALTHPYCNSGIKN